MTVGLSAPEVLVPVISEGRARRDSWRLHHWRSSSIPPCRKCHTALRSDAIGFDRGTGTATSGISAWTRTSYEAEASPWTAATVVSESRSDPRAHLRLGRLLRRDPGPERRDQQIAPVLHIAELVEAADQEVLHAQVPVLQQRIGDLLAGAHVPAGVALRAHQPGDPEPQPLIVHVPLVGEALQAVRGHRRTAAGA